MVLLLTAALNRSAILPLFVLALPGLGSGGFSTTMPLALILGLLTMWCWLQDALGCALATASVMQVVVCK